MAEPPLRRGPPCGLLTGRMFLYMLSSALLSLPSMIDFEQAINELDLQLFEKIPSQTTDDDKRSLLACELAVRELVPEYNFLEIGSYLGGSIQPHFLYPKCCHIYSIDKRPPSQPHARGYDWVYENNSTAPMLELLKSVAANTAKITAIEWNSETITAAICMPCRRMTRIADLRTGFPLVRCAG